MLPRLPLLTAMLVSVVSASASPAEISVEGAYARSSGPLARAGAAFMVIRNDGDASDRLVSAASDASARVELHTHIDQGDGVMRMKKLEEGIVIPAGGSHSLVRGGDHLMFLGLASPWRQGDLIPVTLILERAGEVALEIVVDLEREPGQVEAGGSNGN